MAYSYWEFAFDHKSCYQVMFGLGMPSCETVNEIPELIAFTGLILEPIKSLINSSKNQSVDPFLKLQTFWSMLHGLISINMMGNNQNRENLNQMVLQDFIGSFISGIKG